MIPTLDSMVEAILRREGGWSNHSADRGGPTMMGITLKTLTEWRQRPVTEDELRALTETEAKAIYVARYLTEPHLDRIHDPYVLSLAFDCSINHGPIRVIRWLQKIVGVVDDGILGPQSEIAINSYEPVRLYWKLLRRRVEFYGEIISRDHSQAVFALGWLRRAGEFMEV